MFPGETRAMDLLQAERAGLAQHRDHRLARVAFDQNSGGTRSDVDVGEGSRLSRPHMPIGWRVSLRMTG